MGVPLERRRTRKAHTELRGGQPPKLNQVEQDELIELLHEDQPWKKQEIQRLPNDEFNVEYHPNHLPTFLDELGLHCAIPYTKRPDRPESAEEILGECVEYAFDEDAHDDPHSRPEGDEGHEDWETDDKICTDGSTIM